MHPATIYATKNQASLARRMVLALVLLSLLAGHHLQGRPAIAAGSYVKWLEQVPVTNPGAAARADQILRGLDAQGARQPLPGEAERIFLDSDATAGTVPALRYSTNGGATSTKVLATKVAGIYQLGSNASADWFVDIPAGVQTNGANVTYSLLLDTSGTETASTGFVYNYHVDSLTTTSLTWDVIGLDSNNVATGPDTFQIGAVVTNTSATTMTGVTATFVWDTSPSPNYLAVLTGTTTVQPIGTLAPGARAYAYYDIVVDRNAAARTPITYARAYHIAFSDSTTHTASTRLGRRLVVQGIQSQNRNDVVSIAGNGTTCTSGYCQVPGSLTLGTTYVFTTVTETANGGYEISDSRTIFPASLFRINAITTTYSTGGNTNTGEFGAACYFGSDPFAVPGTTINPNYLQCLGHKTPNPPNTPGPHCIYVHSNACGTGGTGSPITTIYNVTAIGNGATILDALVYDFSGASYHYNTDYRAILLCVAVGTGTCRATAAEVRDLAAAPTGKGGVEVQWTSASEVQHLGYNVYRAPNKQGPWTRVNKDLITTNTFSGGGNYRVTDPTGTAAHFYKIQAVDTHNQTQDFAVFGVSKALPPQVAPASKATQAAQGTAARAANQAALPAPMPASLLTTPYKLTTSVDGVVRVTAAQLATAGVDLTGVRSDRLTLVSGPAGSRIQVPLAMHAASPTGFSGSDSFDFVAQKAPSAYGDSRAYYLSVGNTPGLRMGTVGQAKASGATPASYVYTQHNESNSIYWQYAPNGGAPQPEGPWYGDYTLNSRQIDATLTAPCAVGGAASLTLHLQGWTTDDSLAINHHAQFLLNGNVLGEARWGGLNPYDVTLAVPAGTVAGNNSLTIRTINDTGAANDGVLLVSADLIYPRAYTATGDSLRFTVPAVGNRRLSSVAVGGFSSNDVTLYDVTNPAAPQVVPVAAVVANGYTIQATVPREVISLLAVGSAGLARVDSITPVASGDLRSGGANYVVVAYDSMVSAGQSLAALHQAEGMITRVVPVSAIYDQFGAGVPDAAAIAAFLTATRGWSPAPAYAVLFGSASYDSYNYTNSGTLNLVPTAYVQTREMGRTASDSALASGLALGRLPASTPAEATALVAKLARYMQTHHTWGTQVSLVADGGTDAPTFDSHSNRLAAQLGIHSQEAIYTSQLGNATGPRLLASLNAGRALVNYYGHGSYEFWSQTNILNFNTSTIADLTNAGREAFVTSMNCQSGDFDWAQGTPLLSALVLKPQGGAIGAIGATAASTPAGQAAFNEAVYTQLLAGARAGDALLAGYATTPDPDVRAQFALLGDPAVRVDLGD